jgi:hypothetical protein
MTAAPHTVAPPERVFDRFVASLSLRRVLLAMALAAIASALLNPMFVTPFPVLLGRMLVIALLLLLVFGAAGFWSVSWAPRWLVQVLAVMLSAPLATYLVYLPAVQGQVFEVLRHEGRLSGFVLITGTVLLVAPLLALGALYRERDAQARNQALTFELERSQLERQALDARLRLLHAQIQPHFLFNTLANVQALVESGSAQASPVLRSLIESEEFKNMSAPAAAAPAPTSPAPAPATPTPAAATHAVAPSATASPVVPAPSATPAR